MKHVIVIETVDEECGGQKTDFALLCAVERELEERLTEEGFVCDVYGVWNVSSALAALHELYGVPNCQHPNSTKENTHATGEGL